MLRELADGLLAQMGVTVTARKSGNNTVWVLRRVQADRGARRNGETEESNELNEPTRGHQGVEATDPPRETCVGEPVAAPILRFSAEPADPGERGAREPRPLPLAMEVERRDREVALEAEVDAIVAELMDWDIMDGVTAAEVAATCDCDVAVAQRALDTFGECTQREHTSAS
jgi:hypothetical protein